MMENKYQNGKIYKITSSSANTLQFSNYRYAKFCDFCPFQNLCNCTQKCRYEGISKYGTYLPATGIRDIKFIFSEIGR